MTKAIADILRQSKYTVVMSGIGMLFESGYPGLRDGEVSYDIESKYGYSVDELMNSGVFATRKELFYEFYRNEILVNMDKPPGAGFDYLRILQDKGLIDSIITRRIFGLPMRAGCRNVIDLHGNIYHNYCTHCGKEYPVEYIRDSKKIPICTECKSVVRPGVVLFGEMVDNTVITRAAQEVQKADVLLALGTNLNAALCRQLIHYYEGNKLILITKKEHFSDKKADIVVHSRVDEGLKHILEEL